MHNHSSIELELEYLFNRVGLATFITRLLQHAKDPIVALHVIVGPINVFPSQKHDQLLEDVLADFLDRIGIFIFVPDFEALIAEQLSSMETFV
jgi:hypothetical protein